MVPESNYLFSNDKIILSIQWSILKIVLAQDHTCYLV